VNDDSTDANSGFFIDFPSGGFFGGLAGLAESGESTVPVWLPAAVVTEQCFLAVVGYHRNDDGWVCTGKGNIGD
jgi:hypothetical protein